MTSPWGMGAEPSRRLVQGTSPQVRMGVTMACVSTADSVPRPPPSPWDTVVPGPVAGRGPHTLQVSSPKEADFKIQFGNSRRGPVQLT